MSAARLITGAAVLGAVAVIAVMLGLYFTAVAVPVGTIVVLFVAFNSRSPGTAISERVLAAGLGLTIIVVVLAQVVITALAR
jgi:hypothetical protein